MSSLDKIFSYFGKAIVLEEHLSGRGFYYPPVEVWKERLRFKEIKNTWQNVSNKIIKGQNHYDKICSIIFYDKSILKQILRIIRRNPELYFNQYLEQVYLFSLFM